GKQILSLLRRRRRDSREWNLQPIRNMRAFCRHECLGYATAALSGMICNDSSAALNADLFAIIGSMVSILTMPVVLTTAAISGAAISGATALLRSAAPSVDS